ncbi:MAG: hypothetical protein R6V30_12815 [Paracoccaceae bacterium]|nr:hypothetical protein [Loktanella sp.]
MLDGKPLQDAEAEVEALGAPPVAPMAFPKQDLTGGASGPQPGFLSRALDAIRQRAWH